MIDFDDLTQGDDFSHRFTFADADGVPVDVSDYTFRGQVRQRASTTSALLGTFTFTVSGDDNEILDAFLPASETTGFPRQVSWDIEAELGGVIQTWFHNHEQAVQPQVTVP